MAITTITQSFTFGLHTVRLCVPDNIQVRNEYEHKQKLDGQTNFPYWAQVWPSALGLCHFLVQHPEYINGRQVTELAAGLGLPSLLAASYADKVFSSDHAPDAVAYMQRSAEENKLGNMYCSVLDWTQLPADFSPETLLLSDINYNEKDFAGLYALLERALNSGTTILLSTPQRLIGRDFIDSLLVYCVNKEEVVVVHKGREIAISVLVLGK